MLVRSHYDSAPFPCLDPTICRGTCGERWPGRCLAMTFIERATSIRHAGLKSTPQLRPVQVAADEHDTAGARIAILPLADEVAIGDHVHRLKGEPARFVGIIQHALGAQQIWSL